LGHPELAELNTYYPRIAQREATHLTTYPYPSCDPQENQARGAVVHIQNPLIDPSISDPYLCKIDRLEVEITVTYPPSYSLLTPEVQREQYAKSLVNGQVGFQLNTPSGHQIPFLIPVDQFPTLEDLRDLNTPFSFQFTPEQSPSLNQLSGEQWQGTWSLSTRSFNVVDVKLKTNTYPSSPLVNDPPLLHCPDLDTIALQDHKVCLLDSSLSTSLDVQLTPQDSKISLLIDPPVDGRWISETPLSFTIESSSPERLLALQPYFTFLGLNGEIGSAYLDFELDEETSDVRSASWEIDYEYTPIDTQRILLLDLEWLDPDPSPLHLSISWDSF
jgi:hypothetical protein